jgi:hypothetical protein
VPIGQTPHRGRKKIKQRKWKNEEFYFSMTEVLENFD